MGKPFGGNQPLPGLFALPACSLFIGEAGFTQQVKWQQALAESAIVIIRLMQANC